MAPPLLHLQNIALTFGGSPLLVDAELQVGAGERVCLVGRNGSGKSTFLKLAAGLIEPDGGTRFLQPGSTLRYLPQEPDLAGHETILDYVESGLGPGDDPYVAKALLDALGLTGDEGTGALSGGEARRAAIARALGPNPDILLLDEPTNHLDLPAIEWLEDELRQRRCALVLISHDRRFLTTLSRAVAWLDRGRTRRMDQGFGAFEAWRDETLEFEETQRHKLDRRIAMEEDWVRYGVTARRKRNMRRMGELSAMREDRRSERRAQGQVKLQAAEGETSGKIVIEAVNVAKAYDAGAPLVQDFSVRVRRGDRVGIVGRNGAGKTTLLNLLTGVLAPDAGIVRLGANLDVATLDQSRESLDPAWTVAESLTGGRGDTVTVGGQTKHVAAYMKDFLFPPEQARTPVGVLSGGERGRLMLARALAKPSNLLVLDEPTNDLDLETLDLLQEMLGDYPGTLILISHDRDFLDRVVSSVIVAEGSGRWQEYAGGYTDMLAQRGVGVQARPSAGQGKPAAKGKSAAKETPSGGPKPAPAEPPAAPKGKRSRLGFHEEQALKSLPKQIAKLDADIARLSATLGDGALYARDPAGYAKTNAALAAAQADVAAAEEKWLALETLREEIEGA